MSEPLIRPAWSDIMESNLVVVITGASSGIGRETAIRFASRGACVVLVARGEHALRDVADEIEAAGGRARIQVADVGDWRQVEDVARETLAHFGRIDTWINNAGVAVYATVEQLAIEEIDRVLQVDLLGAIYGTKAVLPHMIERGVGTIINVSSGLGERAVPLLSTYCAAKAGLKGFTESLRVEMAREHPGIAVTLILPSSINTPLYEHARSKRGVSSRPYPPVYDVGLVADAILFAAEHRRREIHVGGVGRLLAIIDRMSPGLVDRYLLQGDRAVRHMLTEQSVEMPDNLFASADAPASARGDFTEEAKSSSLYTSALLHPMRAFMAVMTVAAIGGVLLRLGIRARA